MDDEICKGCGFQCNACHETIRNSHQEQQTHGRQPFVCQGQAAIKNAAPCPFGNGHGLTCWQCEDVGGAGGRRCDWSSCSRMSCGECNIIRTCERCGESCCIFCDENERVRRKRNNFYLFKTFVTCNLTLCCDCDMEGSDHDEGVFTCDEVRVPHSLPPFSLSLDFPRSILFSFLLSALSPTLLFLSALSVT